MTDVAPARAHLCPVIRSGDPQFCANFEACVRAARAQCPVAWDAAHQRWYITGYRELVDLARDWETFSSAEGVSGLDGAPTLLPIDTNPPEHRSWRQLLNPWFGPDAIGRWKPGIEATAAALIDEFIQDGRVDAVSQFAHEFPSRVFFTVVLQLPLDEVGDVVEYAKEAVVISDHQMDGWRKIGEWVSALVSQRRGDAPGSELIDAVVHGRFDGRPVTAEEAFSVLYLLVLAGTETTSSTLSFSFKFLAEHPDVQQLLRDNPSLLSAAVEELLRLFSPAAQLVRTVRRDTTVAGVQLAAGDQVALSFASANRDPREFPDPDDFQLDRSSNRHVGLGIGIHRCLGSHLARAMLQIGLEQMLRRLGPFELAPGMYPGTVPSTQRVLDAVHLVFTPGPRDIDA